VYDAQYEDSSQSEQAPLLLGGKVDHFHSAQAHQYVRSEVLRARNMGTFDVLWYDIA